MTQLASTPQQLAQILRGRRKAMGLTQEAVARRVGLRPKTISLAESEPGRCEVRTLFKLLTALDLEFLLRPKPADSRPSDSTAW